MAGILLSTAENWSACARQASHMRFRTMLPGVVGLQPSRAHPDTPPCPSGPLLQTLAQRGIRCEVEVRDGIAHGEVLPF